MGLLPLPEYVRWCSLAQSVSCAEELRSTAIRSGSFLHRAGKMGTLRKVNVDITINVGSKIQKGEATP